MFALEAVDLIIVIIGLLLSTIEISSNLSRRSSEIVGNVRTTCGQRSENFRNFFGKLIK